MADIVNKKKENQKLFIDVRVTGVIMSTNWS